MSGDFNMWIRKVLKQVVVTGQQAIEEVPRKAGAAVGRGFEAKTVLTAGGMDLEHGITGTIRSGEE